MITISSEFKDTYYARCQEGQKLAKDLNLGVLGLCRDNGDRIYDNIMSLEKLGFKSINYFVYENDSSDNTVEELNRIDLGDRFKFVSEKLNRKMYGQTKEEERTIRLAEYRNKCLDHAKNFFSNTDYILVVDLDFEELSLHGIHNSISWFNDVPHVDGQAGTALELKVQDQGIALWNYDSWAYRGNWWIDRHVEPTHPGDNMLWFGLWIPQIGSSLIQINSGFGGHAIYKTEKYLQGKYEGGDCEHVNFHKYLHKNCQFSMFLNPSMVLKVKMNIPEEMLNAKTTK